MIWVAIGWLTMIEGGQGSLVGLAPVNKELYKDSHPLAYKCTSITNTGDNLDRYLLGRQLMVVIVVFCVNMSGGPIGGATLWGLPDWIINIFMETGLAMILFTCNIGQLQSQVNASLHMLDYLDNYFGLLHASYLIQLLVGLMAGKPIESKEAPRSAGANLFFWARCMFSLAVLCFCLAVTVQALFTGQTTMWEGVT